MKNNLTNKQTDKINKENLIKRQENRIKTKETKINEKPKSRSRKLMNMAYNVRYQHTKADLFAMKDIKCNTKFQQTCLAGLFGIPHGDLCK